MLRWAESRLPELTANRTHSKDAQQLVRLIAATSSCMSAICPAARAVTRSAARESAQSACFAESCDQYLDKRQYLRPRQPCMLLFDSINVFGNNGPHLDALYHSISFAPSIPQHG